MKIIFNDCVYIDVLQPGWEKIAFFFKKNRKHRLNRFSRLYRRFNQWKMWVNFRISSYKKIALTNKERYKRPFFSIKFNSVGVSLSQGLHILFMTQTDDGTPKTSVPKHFDTHLDTLKIGLSPAKIENHVRDRALPSWKFSRRLARDICPGEYFSF